MSTALQMQRALDACAEPRPSTWSQAWEHAQSVSDPDAAYALARALVWRYRLTVSDAFDLLLLWARGLAAPRPVSDLLSLVMLASKSGGR